MNLIYSNGEFRATKFSETQTYILDEITFFIEKKYAKLKFYLIVKDKENHLDIVLLKQTSNTNPNYCNYGCDISYPVNIHQGVCSISIIGIDLNLLSIELSSPYFILNLESDIYNLKSQIKIMEQFNKTGADLYDKTFSLYQQMLKMSELNIQMLGELGGD